jgi:hypothetical protein
MIVTVSNAPIGAMPLAMKPVGTLEYEFSYQAPSEQIFQSLETVSITTATGSENPKLFDGAIGLQLNGDGSSDVEGVSTTPGNTTNTWSFTTSSINSSYESIVESMMGAVNGTPFKGREAGSMRFVFCTSQAATNAKTVIRFGFQRIMGVTNFQVGNITVPRKDGHDYLWVHRELQEKTLANGQKIIAPAVRFAVVERIFPRVNFALLGF